MQQNASQLRVLNRRGFLTPLIALALLVVMAAAALVVDSLWLQSARVELQSAAEAAALAAARELAGSDRMCWDGPSPNQLERARAAAGRIAENNLVAGRPARLDTDRDVRFGRRVLNRETGRTLFVETEFAPTSVVVTARCTRRAKNPVALLIRTASGRNSADVVVLAEATLDNRIRGIRPRQGVPAPVLPFAILNDHKRDKKHKVAPVCWKTQIERCQGPDQLAWNPDTGQVLRASDGLPEITVHCHVKRSATGDGTNAQMIDLGSNFDDRTLIRQVYDGITRQDVQAYGDALLIQSEPVWLTASPQFSHTLVRTLQQMVGAARLCLLYDSPENESQIGAVAWSGLVGVRIMGVQRSRAGWYDITLQPAVVVTSAVVLARDDSDDQLVPNPYVYKLRLTR